MLKGITSRGWIFLFAICLQSALAQPVPPRLAPFAATPPSPASLKSLEGLSSPLPLALRARFSKPEEATRALGALTNALAAPGANAAPWPALFAFWLASEHLEDGFKGTWLTNMASALIAEAASDGADALPLRLLGRLWVNHPSATEWTTLRSRPATNAPALLSRFHALRRSLVTLCADRAAGLPLSSNEVGRLLSGYRALEPLFLPGGHFLDPVTMARHPASDVHSGVARLSQYPPAAALAEASLRATADTANLSSKSSDERALAVLFEAVFSTNVIHAPAPAAAAFAHFFEPEQVLASRAKSGVTAVQSNGWFRVLPFASNAPAAFWLDGVSEGIVVREGASESILEAREVHATNDFYAVAERWSRNGGAVQEQRLTANLPDGLSAVLQRFTARTNLQIDLLAASSARLPGALPGMKLSWQGGSKPLSAAPETLASRWWNLADSAGMVSFSPSGWTVLPPVDAEKTPWTVSVHPARKSMFTKDEVIAQHAAVIALGRTDREMAALAALLEREGDLQTSRVYLEAGGWLLWADFDEPLPAVRVRRAR